MSELSAAKRRRPLPERTFNVRVGGTDHQLTASEEWVVPTGGGYFFAPSISAMKNVLANLEGARWPQRTVTERPKRARGPLEAAFAADRGQLVFARSFEDSQPLPAVGARVEKRHGVG